MYGIKHKLFFFMHAWSLIAYAQEVVFIDPVVNLCSKKLSTYGIATQALYDMQPFSGDDGPYDCMRTAQALFNEIATIVTWDKTTHEICLEFPHWIVEHAGIKKHPQFWCWDSHVIQKEALKNSYVGKREYLILSQPFFDTKRNITYAAGTRFMRVPENDTEDFYGICLFAPELKKNVTALVAVDSVIIPDDSLSCAQRRLICRDLIRSWVQGIQAGGIIPYVWGGSSYVTRVSDEQGTKQEGMFFGHITNFWTRDTIKKAHGFDCSSLIMRAAQIVGIPYYYKTSQAAFVFGAVINDFNEISEGDIVVWPGHMFMISDLKKGLLIEAKGYDAGFGKVQEVPLSKRFKGIATYKKLYKAYKNNIPLHELDVHGNVIKIIPQFKIISLCGA